jgi:hypothetical protein
MTYVYDIDVDTTIWLFVCANVAPRGHEVELLRAPTHQEPEKLPWGGPQAGERHRCEDSEVRPVESERAVRRCWFDDLGVGPPHAPLTDVREDFEDIRCHLEAVLQGMPKRMWSHIQDEGILE